VTKKTRSLIRRPVKKDDAFGPLAFAVGDYLKSLGWTALVVGSPRIQQQPGDREFNYEFVVRFTGGKKKA